MKRIKKIFAFALAMVMMLAMNVTVFAENAKDTIKVTGLASTGTNTVQYVKVLEPNVKSATGYDFVKGMKFAKDENSDYTVAEFLKLDGSALQEAVATIDFTDAATMKVNGTSASADVAAGLYAVKATNAAQEGDSAIVYNYMVIEVEYDKATLQANGTYEYNVSKTGSAVAKYTTIPVTKVATDEDKIVEIGSTQEYTITTYIPSEMEFNEDIAAFTITDKLSGATYQDGTVSVFVGNNGENAIGRVDMDKANGQLVVSFSQGEVEANVGQQVVITYKVTVTDCVVENTVLPSDGKHKFTTASEKLFTGSITLTKYASDDDNVDLLNNEKLAGAGFIVKNIDNTGKERYAKFDEDNKFAEWVAQEDATVVTTSSEVDSIGTVTVSGLDAGTYYFIEVVAPTGYSINNNPAEATLALKGDATVATAVLVASTTMIDTTLSALPSTGGIGTTIFTIAGVAIMVLAAGLFFVSRRKNAR